MRHIDLARLNRIVLSIVIGTLAPAFGQTVESPRPTRPGDCVLPLPPGLQEPPGGIGAPITIPTILKPSLPAIELPGIGSRFTAFVDPIDLLLTDLPVGGTGDDASMHAMIGQFLNEIQTQTLFSLAHQLHVQLTRRSAHLFVIDGTASARLQDCLKNDPNNLRRAFALVALYKEGHAPATSYLEADDPWVRIAALRWLAPPLGIAESQATKVVERLLEDTHHYHAGVRSAAARALGSWGFTTEALDGLKALATSDADPTVRAAALEGLAAVHSLEVRSVLVAIWRSETLPTSDRDAAFAALQRTGILPDPR